MIFLRRMFAISRGHRRILLIAIAGSVLYTALALVPALLIRQFLISLGSQTDGNILWLLGGLMVAVTALMALMCYLEGAFGHMAAYGVLHDLRMRTYQHLQRLSTGFHTRQQSGTMAAKLIGDVETLELFTAHAGIQLIVAAVIPLILGLVMLIANWRLALVALAPIPVILVLLIAFRRPVYRAFATYREELGRINGMIIDHVQGVGVLKTFAALRPAWKQVEERSNELSRAAIRMNLLHTSYFAGVEWMATVPMALVLVVGGFMTIHRSLSLPDLVLFLFLTPQLYRPLTDLNRQIEGLRNAQAATDRIFGYSRLWSKCPSERGRPYRRTPATKSSFIR